MSERDWVKPLAIGLAAVLAAGFWAAYHVGAEVGEIRGQSLGHIASYEAYARDEMRNVCLTVAENQIAECVAKIISATNEQQRAEANLVAQTEMARWAFYMLIATVAMAVITAIGVFFVWMTLLETAVGVDVMRQEQRPWLKFDLTGRFIRFDGEFAILDFEAKVSNFGKTVASGVRIKQAIFIWDRLISHSEARRIVDRSTARAIFATFPD